LTSKSRDIHDVTDAQRAAKIFVASHALKRLPFCAETCSASMTRRAISLVIVFRRELTAILRMTSRIPPPSMEEARPRRSPAKRHLRFNQQYHFLVLNLRYEQEPDVPRCAFSRRTDDEVRADAAYRQLYTALRHATIAGQLKPGMRLPSTRALAEDLKLSRTTVIAAYAQLRAEGYLEGKVDRDAHHRRAS